MIVEKSQADIENELREVGKAVAEITGVVVEEPREQLVPSPAQWARAQALREAREVYMPVGQSTGTLRVEEVEQLTLRWARLIETGSADAA